MRGLKQQRQHHLAFAVSAHTALAAQWFVALAMLWMQAAAMLANWRWVYARDHWSLSRQSSCHPAALPHGLAPRAPCPEYWPAACILPKPPPLAAPHLPAPHTASRPGCTPMSSPDPLSNVLSNYIALYHAQDSKFASQLQGYLDDARRLSACFLCMH